MNTIYQRNRWFVDLLVIGLAIFFCAATLIAHLPRSSHALPQLRDRFDPDLRSISSIDAATLFVKRSNPDASPVALADAADEFVRRRFFHSYSFYNPRQNWLAYIAGYVWLDLRSPVRANDILQHRRAACSQQVIVFDAIMRRLGFQTAVVRFEGHMTAAVKVDGEWRVYDADREIEPRSYPLSRLLAGDPAVLAIYRDTPGLVDLPGQIAGGRVRLTDVDGNPASHASLFDAVTKWLSIYGWLVFAALAILWFAFRRRSSERSFRTAKLAS